MDLSGPHEATPAVGHRVGQAPGYYFVVLTAEGDYTIGYTAADKQTETQATLAEKALIHLKFAFTLGLTLSRWIACWWIGLVEL